MSRRLRVTVAIPVYNEVDVLPELLARVRTVLDRLPPAPHQVLFADDGSWDGTFELLEREAARDSRIGVVSLSRNFGHQAALTAALDHAWGDVVVVMDGDMQDDPDAIPEFLRLFADGYDVVYAIRTQRKESLLLRIAYSTFYRIASTLSNLNLPLGAGDFGLMSRRVVEQIRRTPERHRYVRGLRSWVGFRQIGIEVERGARSAGTSKYSLGGLFRLAFDGIFAFSVVPIRAATWAGILCLLLASVFGGYSVLAKLLFDQPPRGFTALTLIVVFLSGVQLLFCGVLGEYIGRIYDEVKARPVYVVRQLMGSTQPPPGNASTPAAHIVT